MTLEDPELTMRKAESLDERENSSTDHGNNGFQVPEEILGSVEELNNVVVNGKNIRILHLNIRSIAKNYRELDVLLETFQCKPDFVVCTETWEVGCPGFFKLKNYYLRHSACNITKAGGVIIYINNRFTEADVVVSKKYIGRVEVLDLKIVLEGEPVYVTGVYRPHKTDKIEFVSDVYKFLNACKRRKNHVVIGDMNINILDSSNTVEDYLNNYCELEYRSYINSITRPQKEDENTGTCIDHLFVKNTNFNIKSYTVDRIITDHHMIVADFELQLSIPPEKQNFFIDFNEIKRLSNNYDWNHLMLTTNVNGSTNALVEQIQVLIEKSKKKVRSKTGKKRKWWITGGLVKSCENKKKLSNALKKNPQNKELRAKYCKYVALLQKLLRMAEEMYDCERVQKLGTSNKKMWQFLNEKLGRESHKQHIHVINSEKHEILRNEKNIANEFNKFYVNVARELKNKKN